MHPERQRRLWIVVGSVIALALGISLVLYAMRQNINYFYTPTQILNGEAPKSRTVNTGGLVVKGSVKREHDSLKVQFILSDVDKEVVVHYDGILPDLFREGQGIIAIGKITEQNIVVADQILAKHDENYMSPEVKDAIEKGEQRARERSASGASS